jgi:hypothetical protein
MRSAQFVCRERNGNADFKVECFFFRVMISFIDVGGAVSIP